jgi:hypothetical protein
MTEEEVDKYVKKQEKKRVLQSIYLIGVTVYLKFI